MANYTVLKTNINNKKDESKEDESKIKKDDKKMKKEKISISIPALTEDEYKEKINIDFKENKMYLKVIEEAVKTLTDKGKSQLPDLVNAIKLGLRPSFIKDENGNVISAQFGDSLSDKDLENYVIYLPVEMFSALDFIQTKALDSEYAEYMAEMKLSEKMLSIDGGTVQERIKAAEIENMFPAISSLIKKRVYYNIKGEIESANRIYEALKKVLQSRIDDKKLFGKTSNY